MGVGIADDWLNCKQAHISARRCAHMPAHQLKDKASGSSKKKKKKIQFTPVGILKTVMPIFQC